MPPCTTTKKGTMMGSISLWPSGASQSHEEGRTKRRERLFPSSHTSSISKSESEKGKEGALWFVGKKKVVLLADFFL